MGRAAGASELYLIASRFPMKLTTPPAAGANPTGPTPTEIVTRPDPGLARGTWEAPAWTFWVLLLFIVLGASAYLLHRLGLLRLRKRERAADSALPPSRTRRS